MENQKKHADNRLKAWRKRRGLTLEAAAELAGFTSVSLNRYENGNRPVTIDILETLAKVYDTTPAALLNEVTDELSSEERLILNRLRQNPSAAPMLRAILDELTAYEEVKSLQ